MKEKTPDKTVSGILQSLMKSPRFAEDRPKAKTSSRSELTSLGVVLIRQDDGRFFINLTDVKVFSGISEFVQLMAGDVIQQSSASSADVMARQVVDSQLTPELGELGIAHVLLYVRSKPARQLVGFQDAFRRKLRLVFDAIQSARWGGLLFPSAFAARGDLETGKAQSDPPALLFPFHLKSQSPDQDYYLLVEHDLEGKFLRITIENAEDSRLYLKRIPHRVIKDLDHRYSIQDAGKVAEQIFQGIHRECQNQQDEYTEIPGRQPVLFERLFNAGLRDIVHMKFRWPLEDSGLLVFDREKMIVKLLSKILLLFEDQQITGVISEGALLEMLSGKHRVFLDVSRGGACLNISLFEQRETVTIDEHLDKLPCLSALVNRLPTALEDVRVLLIHHITSQVLGLIKALDQLHCSFLQTLFIKYKGVVPDRYLEALFTLPESRFRFHALQRVETRDSIEGCYILSKHYSPSDDLVNVERALLGKGMDYFQAMRMVAGHLFFSEAFIARSQGQLLLLIEDGGYVAPLINRFCLEEKSLRESLDHFSINEESGFKAFPAANELDQPLSTWLKGIFPGSIEHTRNGYDLLREIQTAYGRLAFPACSIAISDLKNIQEARECSAALLHAAESILHSMGHILSRRHALITGCRGNIGRNLMKDLSQRIVDGSLCGVDIVVDKPSEHPMRSGTAGKYLERKTVQDIPQKVLLNLDLIMGTVGRSVIDEGILEKLVVEGRREAIFFASGSTKTVEFTHLTHWLQKLLDSANPAIQGIPVSVRITPVKDPQTGLVQGNRARIHFKEPVTVSGKAQPVFHKDLYLLGDMMPINFLYYGVPAEIIDEVLCQLLQLSIGFITALRENRILPSQLLAVDHEINTDAKPIPPGCR